MKKGVLKISNFIILILIFSCLPVLDGWANSFKKPEVVRKKIIIQKKDIAKIKKPVGSDLHMKEHALRPKSDIAVMKNHKSNKETAAFLSQGINEQRPPYDPAGKIDPFEPLLKEKPEVKTGTLVPVGPVGKKKTPLEKIDLSQLMLKGLIFSHKGNKGLVQESSGKGHIISIGTKIGTNGGKVSIILKDKIIIEEKMKNYYGQIFIEKRELPLHKNSPKI